MLTSIVYALKFYKKAIFFSFLCKKYNLNIYLICFRFIIVNLYGANAVENNR